MDECLFCMTLVTQRICTCAHPLVFFFLAFSVVIACAWGFKIWIGTQGPSYGKYFDRSRGTHRIYLCAAPPPPPDAVGMKKSPESEANRKGFMIDSDGRRSHKDNLNGCGMHREDPIRLQSREPRQAKSVFSTTLLEAVDDHWNTWAERRGELLISD